MNRCLESVSYEELNNPNLNGILIFPEDLKRTLQLQPGDRAIFTAHGEYNQIVITVKPSHHRAKVEIAKSVVEDLQLNHPNCFRTRTEENKTVTTFWPNGYLNKEITFTAEAEPPIVEDEKKEVVFTAEGEESYEGIATLHPNDKPAHIIGKAISYIRAYAEYVKAIEGNNWYEYDLAALTR